jgi:hypothetical protein
LVTVVGDSDSWCMVEREEGDGGDGDGRERQGRTTSKMRVKLTQNSRNSTEVDQTRERTSALPNHVVRLDVYNEHGREIGFVESARRNRYRCSDIMVKASRAMAS